MIGVKLIRGSRVACTRSEMRNEGFHNRAGPPVSNRANVNERYVHGKGDEADANIRDATELFRGEDQT